MPRAVRRENDARSCGFAGQRPVRPRREGGSVPPRSSRRDRTQTLADSRSDPGPTVSPAAIRSLLSPLMCQASLSLRAASTVFSSEEGPCLNVRRVTMLPSTETHPAGTSGGEA